MDKLIASIELFQQSVFEYRSADIPQNFLSVINELEPYVNVAQQQRPLLNEVLNAICTAFQRQDYLLVADYLEYELKPVVAEMINREH